MNNNGARNAAIRLAFESPTTRFAFPLDSNCAFTQAGLAALLDTISESEALERGGKDEGKAKDFVTVPMSRLLRNEDFAKWNEPVEFGEGEGARLKESRWERLRPDGQSRSFLYRTCRAACADFYAPILLQLPPSLKSGSALPRRPSSPRSSATAVARNCPSSGLSAGFPSRARSTSRPTHGSCPTDSSPPTRSRRSSIRRSRAGGRCGCSVGTQSWKVRTLRGWADARGGGSRGS